MQCQIYMSTDKNPTILACKHPGRYIHGTCDSYFLLLTQRRTQRIWRSLLCKVLNMWPHTKQLAEIPLKNCQIVGYFVVIIAGFPHIN